MDYDGLLKSLQEIHHGSISWVRWIQSTLPNVISLTSTLILSFHTRIALSSGTSFQVSQQNFACIYYLHTLANLPAHLTLLALITLISVGQCKLFPKTVALTSTRKNKVYTPSIIERKIMFLCASVDIEMLQNDVRGFPDHYFVKSSAKCNQKNNFKWIFWLLQRKYIDMGCKNWLQ